MKFLLHGILNVQGKSLIDGFPLKRSLITRAAIIIQDKAGNLGDKKVLGAVLADIPARFEKIRSLGCVETMEDYERRKLRVFNVLNFFQLVFGLVIPLAAFMTSHRLSTLGWIAACMPALVSLLVLWLNSRRNYEVSTLCYFILYPVITSIVYLSGMNLGIELFFILYGVLAVFFIQDIGHMIFTITLSMVSYFILTVVWRNYQFQLEVNGVLFLFNHFIAIIFIFFGLYLLKRENADYQLSILNHNRVLHEKNIEIENQRKEISMSAALLNTQACELRELNTLKNKLFSVVAHDLRAPMYALRNMFTSIERYKLSAAEVRAMIPDAVNDLNFTTALMENLLQWAKTQMQTLEIKLERIDIAVLAEEAIQLINSQALAKKIKVVNDIDRHIPALAQQDMIRMVLRNLISNAIKFTPRKGTVRISCFEQEDTVEVCIEDSGVGISPEALEKIAMNDYYTTRGTAKEAGNGLGLILCKEFIVKNGGTLNISSTEGKGSRFSFTLKKHMLTDIGS